MIMKTVRYTSAAAASLRRIGAQDRAALIADLVVRLRHFGPQCLPQPLDYFFVLIHLFESYS